MPFVKGKSGNPRGRPKRTKQELDLIEACKQKAPAALRVLEEIMRNGETERNRLSAAQIILERAYGKPIQGAVHKLAVSDPRPPYEYSDEELLAIISECHH